MESNRADAFLTRGVGVLSRSHAKCVKGSVGARSMAEWFTK